MTLPGDIRIRILTAGLSLAALFALGGCIRDGLDDCAVRSELYIVVREGETDFTPDQVGRATAYLFDRNRCYIGSVPVNREQIAGRVPVTVPAGRDSRGWVVVWGNLGASETADGLVPGHAIDEASVRLLTGTGDFTPIPDDLYYGIMQLSGKSREEVVITPKMARIHIIVRGLTDGKEGEDYYAVLRTYYNRYDFGGTPCAGNADLKLEGLFDERRDWITKDVCRMIHCPVSGMADDPAAVMIGLWRRTTAEDDALLVSTDQAMDGLPIRPQPGKTTNILIEFQETGDIEVTVVITGWDEVYQADEW